VLAQLLIAQLTATTISANQVLQALLLQQHLSTAAAAYNIAINGGGTITNAVTFSNSGTLSLAGTTAFTAGVTATLPSSISN
jgi:hypothetical protein